VTYVSTVLADGPVHYWRLADPYGQVAHDIGSAPFALMNGRQNTPPFGYSGVASDGGSCEFDTASNPLRSWDAFAWPLPLTWEGWIWMQSSSQGQQMLMSSSSGGNDMRFGFVSHIQASFVCQGANFLAAVADVRQAWHHVAITITGGNLRGYLDGVLLGTQAGAVAMGNGEFGIGRRLAAADLIAEGFITEVALYGTALTAGQLLAHVAAADTAAFRPVFTRFGGSNYPSAAPSISPDSTSLSDVLKSVRSTYRNAP
jgi:hypothetical protein